MGSLLTWGWRLTVMGEMLLLKPGMEGAMGLARWRNSSVSIAMLRGRPRGGGGRGEMCACVAGLIRRWFL